MNDRYILLLASIATANASIIKTFGYAIAICAAYAIGEWYPERWRRPYRALALAFALGVFITVYFIGS